MRCKRGWRPGRGGAIAALFALVSCAASSWENAVPAEAPAMSSERVARDVAWLADDAREGRGPGSAGLAASASYLSEGFRAAGFAPGGADGSYLQSFEMTVARRVARARLRLGDEELLRGRDFDVLLSSRNGRVRAPLVFVGYGITSTESGYDDYAGVDVGDRIALVLDDRPGGETNRLGGALGTQFLKRAYKAVNARHHGAAALLLAPSSAEATGLPAGAGHELANPAAAPGASVLLAVSRAAAERIVDAGGGASLAERQRAIEASNRPASEVLTDVLVEVEVEIERERGAVANVVAIREGVDPSLKGEAVVIGAHYDHLGTGQFGTLAPDRRGEVHNGADDNASGAAGLLELARAFGAAPPTRRTLILVAFTGEETGLIGSREYLKNPVVPIEDTVAMLNLDMVGRLRDGKLVVFGVETSPAFPPLVRRAAAGAPLEVSLTEGGYSPSDQTSFYAKDVPVLFFFTGSHGEYHTPDDDSQLINAEGEIEVLGVVYRVARALLDAPARPQLVAGAAPAGGGGRGYGPYLGTVPDFAGESGRGVLLQGVRPESPAATAGLRAGDRLVAFDGAPIANLAEFAALLFSARPGQRVEIVAIRDGQRIVTQATLGQRR